jgi:Glycosyl hydrolases family 25
VLDFLRHLEDEIKARPILYTYPNFLVRTGAHDTLRHYPLWYAAYGPYDGDEHAANPPTQFQFVVHQYTSRGRVPGIPGTSRNPFADLNVLKLNSLEPILYKGSHDSGWRDKLDLYAGGKLITTGNFRSREGTVTDEARRWIEAVRASGGHGTVAPHHGQILAPEPPGVVQPPMRHDRRSFAGGGHHRSKPRVLTLAGVGGRYLHGMPRERSSARASSLVRGLGWSGSSLPRRRALAGGARRARRRGQTCVRTQGM